MRPLNFAILKYFTGVKEACAADVIAALTGEYGHFKALKKPAVVEAIMTAEANGLLQETRYELDGSGRLCVYYAAPAEGSDTINHYIPD